MKKANVVMSLENLQALLGCLEAFQGQRHLSAFASEEIKAGYHAKSAQINMLSDIIFSAIAHAEVDHDPI